MDDTEALLARTVARTASAWLRTPTSVDLYRRLVNAIDAYDAYRDPTLPLDEPQAETLDADDPQPLGNVLPALEDRMRSTLRRTL